MNSNRDETPLIIFYISKSNFLYQAINHDLEEGCFTKPKYEKPIAMPLGEVVQGSGHCNAGSAPAIAVGSGGNCNVGSYPSYCLAGGVAQAQCSQGNQTYRTCSYGLTADCCCRNDPTCFNQ